MMLELHDVTVGQLIRQLSLTVSDGQLATIAGPRGSGKSTLLRAVLGFLPVDGGHISIDGELLTPLSAPFFRRQTAYVPQHLSVPDGYDGRLPSSLSLSLAASGLSFSRWAELTADERYLLLVRTAVGSGKPLLVVDEPPVPLSETAQTAVDALLTDAASRGTTVLAVNPRFTQNSFQL